VCFIGRNPKAGETKDILLTSRVLYIVIITAKKSFVPGRFGHDLPVCIQFMLFFCTCYNVTG